MELHPLRARRERRERAQRDLEVFRAVRRVARDELRALARHADDPPPSLEAAVTALDRATTTTDVVAIEPHVRAARAALGIAEPEGRRGYQVVADAARVAAADLSQLRRNRTLQQAQATDDGRGTLDGLSVPRLGGPSAPKRDR